MKSNLIIIAILCFSSVAFAETCPFCGQEIAPVVSIQVEKNMDGSIKTWEEIIRDSKENILSKRNEEYVYYETGEIKQIVQKLYDEKNNLLKQRKVIHSLDNSFPVTEDVEVPK